MYKIFIRPILFLFPPEKAHHITFFLLKFLMKLPGVKFITRKIFTVKNSKLERTIAGLTFPNPVGVAAGLDKNATHIHELTALGFGFVEIGTVTPRVQPGNEKPRMFRLPKDLALINRMGFNNDGADVIANRLRNRPQEIIIGGNIGKNKDTPNEKAIDDYCICFEKLFDVVDYFVVNVSSPNTPGLRKLQEKEPLNNLLSELMKRNNAKLNPKPIFLKIAPDLTNEQLDEIIEIAIKNKIAGMIATNTTISREKLVTTSAKLNIFGKGGLSGKPLFEKSLSVVKYICEKSNHTFPVIAVGGIISSEDAKKMLDAGASLVQLYTGFIYEGPTLTKKINKSILA